MNEPTPQQPASSEAALEAARREKLRKIRELGIDPWGSRFDDHQPIGEIRAREGEIVVEPAGDVPAARASRPNSMGPKVRAAGRIVLAPSLGQGPLAANPRLDRHDPGDDRQGPGGRRRTSPWPNASTWATSSASTAN